MGKNRIKEDAAGLAAGEIARIKGEAAREIAQIRGEAARETARLEDKIEFLKLQLRLNHQRDYEPRRDDAKKTKEGEGTD